MLRDGITGFLSTVPVAFAVYVASWAGWFHSTNGYDRQWGAQHPSKDFGWIPDSVRSLWHYHQWMYNFHTHLDSFHQYRANPWSWLIQGRPTSFFYEGPKKGHDGCKVAQCSKAITSLGTPSIWWGATLALLVLLFMWALRRDWRAGRDPGRAAGRLCAVVPVRAPDDLHVLLGRLRAVGRAGRRLRHRPGPRAAGRVVDRDGSGAARPSALTS